MKCVLERGIDFSRLLHFAGHTSHPPPSLVVLDCSFPPRPFINLGERPRDLYAQARQQTCTRRAVCSPLKLEMSASDNTTGPRRRLGVPWGTRVMEPPPTGETMNTKCDLRTRRRTIAGLDPTATSSLPLSLFFSLCFFFFSRETPRPLFALMS